MTPPLPSNLLTKPVMSAALGSMAVCIGTAIIRKRNKITVSRKYRCKALSERIRYINDTPWRRIFTFGSRDDFLVSVNFPKELLIGTMLPLFRQTRPMINNGNPYKKFFCTRGRRPALQSVDLLGLALYYLTRRDIAYKICSVFGLVPSSLHVWIDSALIVLLKTVKNVNNKVFEVRWPNEEEMIVSSSFLQCDRPKAIFYVEYSEFWAQSNPNCLFQGLASILSEVPILKFS